MLRANGPAAGKIPPGLKRHVRQLSVVSRSALMWIP